MLGLDGQSSFAFVKGELQEEGHFARGTWGLCWAKEIPTTLLHGLAVVTVVAGVAVVLVVATVVTVRGLLSSPVAPTMSFF